MLGLLAGKQLLYCFLQQWGVIRKTRGPESHGDEFKKGLENMKLEKNEQKWTKTNIKLPKIRAKEASRPIWWQTGRVMLTPTARTPSH